MRLNVISGQVYGKVDWITSDGRELGMFLRSSENRAVTRCILTGDEVERLIANGLVQKGMMVTAFGALSARIQKRHDNGTLMVEVLFCATRVIVEAGCEYRTKGAIYSSLKGVVMHWEPEKLLLKTYFNPEQGGDLVPNRMTCSLFMRAWFAGLSPESQEKLKSVIRAGREFTASSVVEATVYRTKTGEHIPSLMLLPTDFRLQG